MKSYFLGFLTALLIIGVAFGVINYRTQKSPELAYHITTKNDRLGRLGAFEVFRDDVDMFTYCVYGNGYSLSVPSDSEGLSRLFYSQSEQVGRGTFYELSIRPTQTDSPILHVAYDMSTGDINKRIILKDGKLIVDEQKTEASLSKAVK